MKKIIAFLIYVLVPVFLVSQNLVSITPNNANAGQTLNVTITGADTHFIQGSGTYVDFGFSQGSNTAVINSLNIISNTSILANITVPVNTYTGDYSVYVYNNIDGYLSLYSGFHVNGISQPSLVSITPNNANAGQILNVTITGADTHFSEGAGTYIDFGFSQGSTTAIINSLDIISNTSILANITVPSNTYTGDYSVYVYNNIDGYLSLYSGFHVNGTNPPSLVSITPNNANAGQTLNVSITGADTHFSEGAGTYIDFGFSQGSTTANINSLDIVSNTSILANITVPSNIYTGDYSVYVYNNIDGHLSLYSGFHVNGINPPSLVSINPDNANAGQTLNVTITGADTHFNQGSGTYIDFGFSQGSTTAVINSLDIVSNTSILANITVPSNIYTGDYSVYVYNNIDGYLSLYHGFHVHGLTPPSLVSINPNSAGAGQTLNVTITGVNTNFSAGNGTYVDFGLSQGSSTVVINSIDILSNTSILANITVSSEAYLGYYDVYTYNYVDGYLILSDGFHVGANDVEFLENDNLISIYPNPATDQVFLSVSDFRNTTVKIFNTQGQLCKSQALQSNQTEIKIANLPKGMYLLQIKSPTKVEVRKLIKE
ncbi:MAG: T9SS type A sorting domain-containing protein [Bacteroidales bacterium]|nr:T9SS type A sorting domain-containing protein [Bacteroidales bacterium]